MYNTFQISPSILSNAAFVVSAGIKFLFKHWGHTNVLHPSNIKTFRLPVAHKAVELFEPSACLSAQPFFAFLSLSFHLIFLALRFSISKSFQEAPWVYYSFTVLGPVSEGCSTRDKKVRHRFNLIYTCCSCIKN